MNPTTQDIASAIDTHKLSRLQIGTLVLCFLAMIMDGFNVQVVPYVAPALMHELQIPRNLLGALMSAGLIGMAISGILCGWVADKVGRRLVIIVSILVFGILTIAKTVFTSYHDLLWLQFLSGLGLGGAMPNALALAAEYSPARTRSFTVTVVSCAFPFGGVFGGYAAAAMAEAHGWRFVFWCGGVVAILIAIACVFWLAESVRYLVLKNADPNRVRRIMQKIAPDIPSPGTMTWISSEERISGAPVIALFQEGRALLTCILTLAVMASLLAGYFVVSWSAMLFTLAGLTLSRAVIAGTMIPTGAVLASLLWGRLLDRMWPPLVLSIAAVLIIVCFSLVGHLTASYPLLLTFIFLGGCGLGSQNAYAGFISTLYPTSMRSTAIGTAIGVGRIGSIVGPLIGGALLTRHWSVADLYYVPALGGFFALLCMIAISILPGPRRIIANARIIAP